MRVGVLGAGQLGRMMALAGYPLGNTFHFYDTFDDMPAGQVAPLVVGKFSDFKKLAQIAKASDVITYEFENVPVEAVRFIEKSKKVFPSSRILEVAQDRLIEKNCFSTLQIPTPEFYPVCNLGDLQTALKKLGGKAVLKTRRMGYDGKGQVVLTDGKISNDARQLLKRNPDLILEAFVSFDRELSQVAVRSKKGEIVFYPLVENHHEKGILNYTLAPAPKLSAALTKQARAHVTQLLKRFDYVGAFTVEFFEKKGKLIANEMAPRVHNSGHWTIEGTVTSQFENHVRAITGLPLGSTDMRGYAGMINLIGKLPTVAKLCRVPQVHVHTYGKKPRAGRKLGHVTFVAKDSRERDLLLKKIRKIVS